MEFVRSDLEKKIVLDDEEITNSIARLTSLIQFPTVSSLGPVVIAIEFVKLYKYQKKYIFFT